MNSEMFHLARRGPTSRIFHAAVRSMSTWFADASRWKKSLASAAPLGSAVVPIEVVARDCYDSWRDQQSAEVQNWLTSNGVKIPPRAGHFFVPSSGGVAKVVFVPNSGTSDDGDDGGMISPFAISTLASSLPAGYYTFEGPIDCDPTLSWALGSYKYSYKSKREAAPNTQSNTNEGNVSGGVSPTSSSPEGPILVLGKEVHDGATGADQATATYLVRDLINTPAEDCGPSELQATAEELYHKVSPCRRNGADGRPGADSFLLRWAPFSRRWRGILKFAVDDGPSSTASVRKVVGPALLAEVK